jgi:hypothetical protein
VLKFTITDTAKEERWTNESRLVAPQFKKLKDELKAANHQQKYRRHENEFKECSKRTNRCRRS